MPSRQAALTRGAVKRNGKPATLLDFDEKGIFVSINQFCQETGKDRASVTKRVGLNLIRPMAGPNKNPVYRLRDLIDLVFYRDDHGHVDIDRLDPFRRKAHYSAELDKLKMMQQSGQLIPVADVEQEQARIAKVLTQFLDTLPDILERDCGAGAQMLAKIEQRIDACREDLYKAIRGGDEEDSSSADVGSADGPGIQEPEAGNAGAAKRKGSGPRGDSRRGTRNGAALQNKRKGSPRLAPRKSSNRNANRKG